MSNRQGFHAAIPPRHVKRALLISHEIAYGCGLRGKNCDIINNREKYAIILTRELENPDNSK
jgi:hypothetical protein